VRRLIIESVRVYFRVRYSMARVGYSLRVNRQCVFLRLLSASRATCHASRGFYHTKSITDYSTLVRRCSKPKRGFPIGRDQHVREHVQNCSWTIGIVGDVILSRFRFPLAWRYAQIVILTGIVQTCLFVFHLKAMHNVCVDYIL